MHSRWRRGRCWSRSTTAAAAGAADGARARPTRCRRAGRGRWAAAVCRRRRRPRDEVHHRPAHVGERVVAPHLPEVGPGAGERLLDHLLGIFAPVDQQAGEPDEACVLHGVDPPQRRPRLARPELDPGLDHERRGSPPSPHQTRGAPEPFTRYRRRRNRRRATGRPAPGRAERTSSCSWPGRGDLRATLRVPALRRRPPGGGRRAPARRRELVEAEAPSPPARSGSAKVSTLSAHGPRNWRASSAVPVTMNATRQSASGKWVSTGRRSRGATRSRS